MKRSPWPVAQHPVLLHLHGWYLSAPAAPVAPHKPNRQAGHGGQQRVYRTWNLTAAHIRAWLAHRVEHCAINTGATGSNPVPNHQGVPPPRDPEKVSRKCRWKTGTRPTRRLRARLRPDAERNAHGKTAGKRPTPAGSDTSGRDALQRADTVAAKGGPERTPASPCPVTEVAGHGPATCKSPNRLERQLKQRSVSRGRLERLRSSGRKPAAAIT